VRWIANACVVCSVLIYVFPLTYFGMAAPGRNTASDWGFGLLFVLVPLWVLLAIALGASTAMGALEWLGVARGTQYFLTILTCLAILVETWLSGILRAEPASQIPWA